ncbi:Ribosomal-protein-alanine acetyltransferase [Mycoavidus cysteinexigens]|uniref:[Ribosomal protein bS18]-alanine N-acetyltransferase n=1 Tax=Mycoavidus cysteinexigens TaxID=1553431 RepID=A0A2Z6EUP0_9BURK|nr:ribosomal protein S18-alanine N-acetyltransferase [Mycoavidus cysteinexigens]BBE09106.1 Ribosomal-protein-alanine acetyltransferase [Mycoavidus cysteinexigens]GAM52153.1 ribosomal-protein-S18p-alanine acetyltransferase [bacterium endosymbiont of Mortierella elongata FMR23-6]GLR00229.1 ribosomal-protein-alanine acetyltransferase [Mycoavidus cysteinexigens]
MNAVMVTAGYHFTAMRQIDLVEVMALECMAYPFPWSQANFADALENNNIGICMRDSRGVLLGYCVLMPAVDEMQLLNLCISPALQGQGMGQTLLKAAVQSTRTAKLNRLLLEVRASNQRALRLYQQFGFTVIGRRKEYYLAQHGAREDALVMKLTLSMEGTHA